MTIEIKGLKSVLKEYKNTGSTSSYFKWSMDTSNKDYQWSLCYDGLPIIHCDNSNNLIRNSNNIEKLYISDVFTDIAKIVKEECSDIVTEKEQFRNNLRHLSAIDFGRE